MRQCLDKIQKPFDTILVDGPHFDWYRDRTDTVRFTYVLLMVIWYYKSIARVLSLK